MSSLITIIASGVNRLSEIASRMEKPATYLNRPLQRLIDLGYLKRETPWGSSSRNVKKTLYKVADPFLNFYFRYVVPERSFLELGHASLVYDQIVTPDFPVYCSSFWEDICRDAIPTLMKDKLFSRGMRWWGTSALNRKNIEIDIVSSSADGSEIIVGEVKWRSKVNVSSLIQELDHKISLSSPLQGKKIRKVLFLKHKSKRTWKNLTIYTPEDVVAAFI
jgi:hypothetical protein